MRGLAWGNQEIKVWRSVGAGRDAEGRATYELQHTDTVQGSVHERTSRELVGTSWEQVSEWRAFLPPRTEVNERDVLEDSDGVRYRVMTAVPRRGPGNGLHHHVSCRVMRVEP